MGGRYNQAGREFIVDRIIQRKGSSRDAALRITQSIQGQTTIKDLQALKDAIAGITSDVIAAACTRGMVQIYNKKIHKFDFDIIIRKRK